MARGGPVVANQPEALAGKRRGSRWRGACLYVASQPEALAGERRGSNWLRRQRRRPSGPAYPLRVENTVDWEGLISRPSANRPRPRRRLCVYILSREPKHEGQPGLGERSDDESAGNAPGDRGRTGGRGLGFGVAGGGDGGGSGPQDPHRLVPDRVGGRQAGRLGRRRNRRRGTRPIRCRSPIRRFASGTRRR